LASFQIRFFSSDETSYNCNNYSPVKRSFTMDELQKLEHLSLVSKICSELDNHYNMNDKDLAEFIIDLAEKNPTLPTFKKALIENGAEFADSFMENILRIIKHMKPKGSAEPARPKKSEKGPKNKIEKLAENFPFLSIPNKEEKILEEGEKIVTALTLV